MLDTELRDWDDLAQNIGAGIAPLVTKNQRVCFLPGRLFTGLPLHLARMPDGSFLLEHHEVNYAPNMATLLGQPKLDNQQTGYALVTVTKENDSADFRERALSTSSTLKSRLEALGETVWLRQEEATHQSVLYILPATREILFVCHGHYAGPTNGYGICLADSGHLPPPTLAIEESPDLARFLLTWADLENLTATPTIVVSIGCSSGLTLVAPGGVRYGLEQTLFQTGTCSIISPLWDVEQSTALEWLGLFYKARGDNSTGTVAAAWQRATLEMKARGLHPYFWAPFICNGSIFTEEL